VPVGFFISRPLAQPQTQFSKEIAKATKISEIDTFEVLFANFVVKCLGLTWLACLVESYSRNNERNKPNVP
jgi:hypothetical protein